MKLINTKEIKNQINNCYEHYDPHWDHRIGDPTIMNGFKYYLEREAGLKLDFEVETRNGIVRYKINSIEVVDEEVYMLWLLTWS